MRRFSLAISKLALPIRKHKQSKALYSQFQMDDEAINMPSPLELVHEKWLNSVCVARAVGTATGNLTSYSQLRDSFINNEFISTLNSFFFRTLCSQAQSIYQSNCFFLLYAIRSNKLYSIDTF